MDNEGLTDQEHTNYHQLTDVYNTLRHIGESGEDTIHAPHGLAVFMHGMYHGNVEAQMMETVAALGEAVEKLAAEEDVDIDTFAEDGIVEIQGAVSMEQIIRRWLEVSFIMGTMFCERGYRLAECECGDLTDDKIQELFGHGH